MPCGPPARGAARTSAPQSHAASRTSGVAPRQRPCRSPRKTSAPGGRVRSGLCGRVHHGTCLFYQEEDAVEGLQLLRGAVEHEARTQVLQHVRRRQPRRRRRWPSTLSLGCHWHTGTRSTGDAQGTTRGQGRAVGGTGHERKRDECSEGVKYGSRWCSLPCDESESRQQGRAPCECAQCERVGNIVLNTQTGTRSREGSGLHLV